LETLGKGILPLYGSARVSAQCLVSCDEPVLLGKAVICAISPTLTVTAAAAAVIPAPLGTAEAAPQHANPSNANLIFMDVMC
jgi:hypothetical protein